MAKKADKAGPADDLVFPHQAGAVTSSTYQKLAVEFAKKARTKGEDSLILNALGARKKGMKETPERWVAWLAFFSSLNMRRTTTLARDLGYLGVPCRWPWEFSADAAAIEARLGELLRSYAVEKPAKAKPLFGADYDGFDPEAAREKKEKAAAQRKKEADAAAERAAARGAWLKQKDEEMRVRSFLDANVEPPEVAEGAVGMSYGMMLRLGWTVVQDERGVGVMCRPRAREQAR